MLAELQREKEERGDHEGGEGERTMALNAAHAAIKDIKEREQEYEHRIAQLESLVCSVWLLLDVCRNVGCISCVDLCRFCSIVLSQGLCSLPLTIICQSAHCVPQYRLDFHHLSFGLIIDLGFFCVLGVMQAGRAVRCCFAVGVDGGQTARG